MCQFQQIISSVYGQFSCKRRKKKNRLKRDEWMRNSHNSQVKHTKNLMKRKVSHLIHFSTTFHLRLYSGEYSVAFSDKIIELLYLFFCVGSGTRVLWKFNEGTLCFIWRKLSNFNKDLSRSFKELDIVVSRDLIREKIARRMPCGYWCSLFEYCVNIELCKMRVKYRWWMETGKGRVVDFWCGGTDCGFLC